MTDKQMKFATEYLVDLNATRAYRVAYPNVKKDSTAAAAATRMLKIVNVKSYIDEQFKKIEDSKIADAMEVMKYLTEVLRGESSAEVIVIEGIGEGCSEARKIDKAPDEKERLKAAELLGKRYGLFTEKIKVEDDTERSKKIDNIASILDQMKPVQEGD